MNQPVLVHRAGREIAIVHEVAAYLADDLVVVHVEEHFGQPLVTRLVKRASLEVVPA